MGNIMRQRLGLFALLLLIIMIVYGGTCKKSSSSNSSAGSSAPAPTQSASWGTPALLETDNIGNVVGAPQIAMDGSGNAIAIWAQDDVVTRSHIYVNRYTISSGWSGPSLIESENTFSSIDVSLAMNNSGCAIAVWRQFDGTKWNIWANVAVTGTNWGTAQAIENSTEPIYTAPQIAINNSGDAVAIWVQNNGTTNSIWANIYISGTGWTGAALVETDTQNASFPQVVMDNSSNATAVWIQNDGIWNSVYSSRYITGTTWAARTLIETTGGDVYNPQIAIDGSGNVMAVWVQDPSPSIYATRYISATAAWSAPVEIDAGAYGAFAPQIAMNNSGDAVAVWMQINANGPCRAYANTYISGTNWAGAQLISDNIEVVTDPEIAINASGNAFAIWYQYDTIRTNIWANRYVAGSGWSGPTLIETNNNSDANSHRIAIDSSGRAIAIWLQSEQSKISLWYNRFE